MPFKLAALPYHADPLDPVIDEETMKLHHGKHHALYTEKLNGALANTEWAFDQLRKSLYCASERAIRINQDMPFMPKAFGGSGSAWRPLLALDVSEHAYYPNYQNLLPELEAG